MAIGFILYISSMDVYSLIMKRKTTFLKFTHMSPRVYDMYRNMFILSIVLEARIDLIIISEVTCSITRVSRSEPKPTTSYCVAVWRGF